MSNILSAGFVNGEILVTDIMDNGSSYVHSLKKTPVVTKLVQMGEDVTESVANALSDKLTYMKFTPGVSVGRWTITHLTFAGGGGDD